MKQKDFRENLGRFMTKDLHKTIIKRSRLRNKIILVIGINFLSKRTELSRKNTEKKQNLKCKSLEKNPKRTFSKS